MIYGRLAFLYDVLDWPCEVSRYRHIRPALVGDLKGKVLDAGVGTGRNLAYFSSEAQVTGIDLSDGMLARARARASMARCSVDLKRMDVTRLEFPDDNFDAVISTFLFCVLPNDLQLPALKELVRVTKPGGIIRILEYQYSADPWRRKWMRVMAPVVEFVYGARFDRHTAEVARSSGASHVYGRFVHADTIQLIELKP